MNYFDKYSGAIEIDSLNDWIDSIDGLRNAVANVRGCDGRVVDCMFTVNGRNFTVEVKTEEPYWFVKSGNIIIDAISAFIFNPGYSTGNTTRKGRGFVPYHNIIDFMNNKISIKKLGTIYNSTADIMVKRIGDVFIAGYDLQKMISERDNLLQGCDLMINNKKKRGIDDNWESAAYCVPSERLERYRLNSIEDILSL